MCIRDRDKVVLLTFGSNPDPDQLLLGGGLRSLTALVKYVFTTSHDRRRRKSQSVFLISLFKRVGNYLRSSAHVSTKALSPKKRNLTKECIEDMNDNGHIGSETVDSTTG